LLSVHFNWALSALCRRVIENLSRSALLSTLYPRKTRNKFSNQQRTKTGPKHPRLSPFAPRPLISRLFRLPSFLHILFPSRYAPENQEAACCCLFNKRLLAANTFNRMQFVDCGQSLHFPRFSTHQNPTLSARN